MRIIAGTHKSRAVEALPGDTNRPTTDKIKENMFNLVGPYFEGGLGLDLYSASGNLGIEAVSRGLARMVLVEIRPEAYQVIQKNLKNLELEDRIETFNMDARMALEQFAQRGSTFDLVFLDPPYAEQRIEEDIKLMLEKDLLNDNGFIICESDARIDLPDEIGRCERIKNRDYGTTNISVYKVREEENNE